MKIAVCYTGLIRTLNKTYTTHINNIFNILMNNNIEYDIYVHTWTGKNITNNLEDIKLINPIAMQIDDLDLTFLNSLCFEDYFYQDSFDTFGVTPPYGEWFPNMLKNFLYSLESTKRVTNMVFNSNKNYTHLLFLRMDLLILQPININIIINSPIKNTIIFPEYGSFGGYNGVTALCTSDIVHYFSHRIDTAKEHRKTIGRIAGELFNKAALDKTSINVIKNNFIMVNILREDSTIVHLITTSTESLASPI